MSQKFQYRLVVPLDRELKRIISIRERTDGGLNVTAHVSGLFNISANPDPKAIKESRYSIHVSPRSDSNTIHGTTEHADGSASHHYLSTTALRNGHCQPVFVRSVAQPEAMEPLRRTDNKGPVITLPAYDPHIWTMLFQLWICPPQLVRQQIAAPYQKFRAQVGKFGLIIPFCYAPKPTPDFVKNTVFWSTTEECITEEQRRIDPKTGSATGILPIDTVAWSIWLFNEAIARDLSIGVQPRRRPPSGDLDQEFYPLPDFASRSRQK